MAHHSRTLSHLLVCCQRAFGAVFPRRRAFSALYMPCVGYVATAGGSFSLIGVETARRLRSPSLPSPPPKSATEP